MGRKITVLVLLLSMFAVLGTKLYFLSGGDRVNASVSGAAKTLLVSEIRGNIYDCNFEKLVNFDQQTVTAAKPCIQSADLLKSHLTKQQYLTLLSNIGKGTIFLEETEDLQFEEDTVRTAKVFKRYSKNQTACHVIGYINSADNVGVSGIEKSYDLLLKEDESKLKLRFFANAQNGVLVGDKIEFLSENYFSKKGVKLTIDKNIQKICENAMKLFSNDCGSCVVMDADKSHIKAMLSTPGFDCDNVAKSLTGENSPLLNRALTAYSVGSVFKTVVAAAAVKYGFDGFEYDCKGSVSIGDHIFSCSSNVSHGKENLSSALADSCNTYFISLAMKLGAKKLIETAENLGFSQSYRLCNDISSDKGYLPNEDEIISDGTLANLAFGQGSLMASPLQVAVCYSAMVTDGTLRFPSLVEGTVDTDGSFIADEQTALSVRALDKQVADRIRELLTANFSYENYFSAKPSYKDCLSGGKTSTAQTGWYDENSKEILHSWFAGFVTVGQENYVIVVFKENGTSGAVDCAPVFKEIADRIIIYRRKS